jgi:hypothetical protein
MRNKVNFINIFFAGVLEQLLLENGYVQVFFGPLPCRLSIL